jgi:hypothetical protein
MPVMAINAGRALVKYMTIERVWYETVVLLRGGICLTVYCLVKSDFDECCEFLVLNAQAAPFSFGRSKISIRELSEFRDFLY